MTNKKNTKKAKKIVKKKMKKVTTKNMKQVKKKSNDKLVGDLKNIIKGDVLADEKTLETYSRDASIFYVKPKVVVFPKDEKDVEALVEYAKTHKGVSLTGRAAGTDMTGGPLTQSIVVSFTKYMNKMKRLTGKYAVVEPGLYYHDFEKKMNKKGVMYPSYPASKSLCAMGGIIANNSGGEKSLTFGKTVNHVNNIKVVLADGKIHELKKLNKRQLLKKMKQKDFEGEIYRKVYKICERNYDIIQAAKPQVSKNSCGYYLWRVWDRKNFDLTKLFVGSQGTLGLWTEANIDVVKKKKHSRLVVVTLDDLRQVTPLIAVVNKYHPESLESFDKYTLELGLKFSPEIAKKVHQSLIEFLWGFRREAEQGLLHGIPKFTILVELTGDKDKKVQKMADKLGDELNAVKITNLVMKSEKEGEKFWVMRRQSFNLLRQKIKDKQTVPFIDDFSIKPEYLSEFVPQLYRLLRDHDIPPTLAGHVGDGNFHIIPLMDLTKKKERDKIPVVLDKFVRLVKKYHGTITAEHNDGLIRTPYIEMQYGKKIVKLFEEVKDIFDKDNIFNPGKKVHGSLKYAMSHIKPK